MGLRGKSPADPSVFAALRETLRPCRGLGIVCGRPKRVLHLNPGAGLNFFALVDQRDLVLFVERAVFSRAHRDVPVDLRPCIRALFNALVARIAQGHRLKPTE